MINEKQTEKKVWLDGQLVDVSDAKISVFDHGLLYGDGVFEGIRSYSSRILELTAHLNRLFESAKAIRLDIPYSIECLKSAIKETCKANDISDGYIRLVVTRGVGTLGINPFVCKKPGVFIIADNIQLYPEEFYEKGLNVISSSVIRNHPLAVPPQVKSLNYLNNVLAKIEALDSNVLEAIMFNHLGYVAEATGDNVFIVKDSVLLTPPTQAGALKGITQSIVFKLAINHGLEVVEKDLTRFDLYTADELFLTGTAAEVIPIVELDGRKIGDGSPGDITRKLRKNFYQYARTNGE